MESQLPKTKEELEEQMVDDAFQHLKDTYLASRHRKKIDIINKAFNFARQAHKGVKRLSGEPCSTMWSKTPTTPSRTSKTSSVPR